MISTNIAPVAQLDRAPAFGAGCRGFESSQARQSSPKSFRIWLRLALPDISKIAAARMNSYQRKNPGENTLIISIMPVG